MPLYRCDVVLPMFTGDPSDVVVNTWHFESTATQENFAINTEVFLGGLYRGIYSETDTNRVSYIDWLNVRARVFDLSQPTPRVPVESPVFFTTAGLQAAEIPTEVAAVLSFQSDGMPGEVYQRRYNRVYLGAVPNQWMQPGSSTTFPRFVQAFMDNATTQAQTMQGLTDGPEDLWVQVSRATGSIRSLPVTGGWMDNSPDTQRRRSVDSSLRVNWVPA